MLAAQTLLLILFSIGADHGADSKFWTYMTITAGVLFVIVLLWLFLRDFAPVLEESELEQDDNL